MKLLNNGDRIQFLPERVLLTDRKTPIACKRALTAWEKALTARDETREVWARAAAEARAEFVVFKDADPQRFAAEVSYRVRCQRAAVDTAQREVKAAAVELIASVEQHREALDAVGARLALESYAVEVDATLDLIEARSRRTAVEPWTERSPLVPEGRMSYGSPSAESRLAVLDEVNASALAECAGTRLGLVEVEAVDGREFYGVRLLTTARRAALLTDPKSWTHGARWALVEDEEAAR